MAIPSPASWGVTVEKVSALAPHVGIIDTPPPGDVPADDVFGGEASRHVTRQAVQEWIDSIGALVSAGLRSRSRLVDADLIATVDTAAHDVVLNGAASYLVAAAHPSEASINNQSAYSAVLWQRYVDGLAQLSQNIDAWLVDDGIATRAPAGRGGGSFPAPLFPDGMRW